MHALIEHSVLSPHQLTRLKGVFNCAEIMIEIVIEIGKPCSTIQLKVSCPVQCCMCNLEDTGIQDTR